MEIIPVKKQADIQHLADLAHEIWWQHFPPIIGEAQVEYMVKKFQSLEAISHQIAEGWEYFMVQQDGQGLGYAGLVREQQDTRVQLSKLYVLKSARGKGVGHELLAFIEQKYGGENFHTLWLTVNRFNSDPIKWYKRRGFKVIDEVKMDIGNGFIMDDYIMEKQLGDAKEHDN